MHESQVTVMAVSSREPESRGERVAEPIIQCPHCQAEIKLTESLAAPLLRSKEQEFKRLEGELREREASLRRQRDRIEEEVSGRLAVERGKVADEAQRKARLAMGGELESKQRELEELGALLKSRDTKLAEALQAHATVVRKQRELEEREREIELTIEKRVSANVSEIQQKAKQEAENLLKSKVTEKDQLIRFTRDGARWIADEKWHPQQEATWLPDGRYELRIPYREPRELVMDIMRQGKNVEVVAPDELREQVRRELQEALSQYSQPFAG